MAQGKPNGPEFSGPDYKKALEKIAQLRKALSEANAFRLDSSVAQAQEYFEGLRKSSPRMYDFLKMQRKEIAELAIKRRTGKSVMLD